MYKLDDIEDAYKALYIERAIVKDRLKKEQFSLRVVSKKIRDHEEARSFYTQLSKTIQAEVKQYIEEVTTTAIQTIFEYPYTYHLEFEEERNTITCTPVIKDGDKQYNPKDDQGGGMLDIIGFINKIILWSIESPRTRNTLVFDEPFRFCGELTLKVAKIVRELCQELGFQVIIFTHERELANICDRVWLVTKPKYSSKLRRIK